MCTGVREFTQHGKFCPHTTHFATLIWRWCSYCFPPPFMWNSFQEGARKKKGWEIHCDMLSVAWFLGSLHIETSEARFMVSFMSFQNKTQMKTLPGGGMTVFARLITTMKASFAEILSHSQQKRSGTMEPWNGSEQKKEYFFRNLWPNSWCLLSWPQLLLPF